MSIVKRFLDRTGLLAPAFRLREAAWAARMRRAGRRRPPGGSRDNLPIPPEQLIVMVGGPTTVDAFLHGGATIAGAIAELSAAHGAPLPEARAILDFGCGCGRVLRHWHDLRDGAVCGSDYNPALVAWCARHLPFATCSVNQLAPPLPYPDRRFDVVYSFSVFTHLPAALQGPWFAEIARVTAPGGLFLVSLHGPSHAARLTPAEGAELAAGGLVVRYESVAGTNLCAAFHSEAWIRRELTTDWECLSITPDVAGQDMVALKRRAS